MKLGRILAVMTTLSSRLAFAQDGFIRGHVFDDASSLPLAGIALVLATPAGELTIKSDEDGAFAFAVAPGSYSLSALQGEAKTTVLVEVSAGAEVEVLVYIFGDGRPPRLVAEEAKAAADLPNTASTARGTIAGKIYAIHDGAPISEARVYVRGARVEAKSDAMGGFALELLAGTYELSVLHLDYSTQSIPNVTVQAGEETRLDIEMTPAAVQLEALTVSVPRIEGGTASLLQERRERATVSDVLGAEQMAKAADSNAATALTRVTGLSLIDGKYVFVRGLGDRYSSVLLNGSTLPSPEPERRVIPLDVFPAKLLEGIVVSKSYAAELPGEFGGGVIELRTRSIPKEPVLKLSASVGADPSATLRPGLYYQGGAWDWLGIDDGTRALPKHVAAASAKKTLREADRFSTRGYSPEDLERFGEALPNNWVISERALPPSYGFGIDFARKLELFSRPLGVLAAVNLSHATEAGLEDVTIFQLEQAQKLTMQNRYTFESADDNVLTGGILSLGVDLEEGNEVGASTVLVRSTDKQARIYGGYFGDAGEQIRVSRLLWTERMLFAEQLFGHHRLGADDTSLSWRYTFSLATRYEPDRRVLRYDLDSEADTYELSNRAEANQRVFSDLDEKNHDLATELTTSLPPLTTFDVTAKLGLSAVFKDRTSSKQRLKLMHKGPLANDPEVLSLGPDRIFGPENLGPDGFQLEDSTRATDNYFAKGHVLAAFAAIDLARQKSLALTLGTRVESSRQEVTTYELFNPDDKPVVSRDAHLDVMPSLSVTWNTSPTFAVRSGASGTVNRPDFREMSPACFTDDVTGGREVCGNPDVERARLWHFDLRAEWFPSADEVFSLGIFYKHFVRPIEVSLEPGAAHFLTFKNADAARNLGVEAEARKWLRFVHPALADFYVATNVAVIRSRVSLPKGGIETSKERALQGQSPYVVNAQLGYSNTERGLDASLLYNVAGRYIASVEALGAPDTYEEARHKLDFAASVKLGETFSVSLKAKNLLASDSVQTQGPHTTRRAHGSRELGLGLGASF